MNLTEQWKKGKLPNGWYYVKGSRAEGIYAYTAEYLNNMYRPRNGERIIEQVPSYEEWKDIKDDLATCDKDLNNVCEQKEELYEENTKLKELLKEANNWLKAFYAYEKSDFVREQVKQCLNKMEQELGE